MIADLSPDYLRRLLLDATRADLVPADAAGESGSVVGGGASRITIRFDDPDAPDRLVRDARVRVLATAAPHGPAAVLLERIVGSREIGRASCRERVLWVTGVQTCALPICP